MTAPPNYDSPVSVPSRGPGSSRAAPKPQRVLACMLCQHRKIKCDRRFPCANCLKINERCVPATAAPRHRRRRVPDQGLLERVRRYEDLLRQNNINFETLPEAVKASPSEDGTSALPSDNAHSGDTSEGADSLPMRKRASNFKINYEPVDVWSAMNQNSPPDDDDDDESDDDDQLTFLPHDDLRDAVVKKAWDQTYANDDHLIFASRKTNVDLSTLHPPQGQIFKLWQIYLDNVSPLLKVTHTPTLQGQIIDAASDMGNISPALEALMFSVYCVTISSIEDGQCRSLFGIPKKESLMGYQFGCQQAFMNCGILRTSNRDCLTALYLYLISIRPDTDPRSLSSMLGIAVRIAQRMGIQHESAYAKCSVFEAEMCRRLWWSLIIFDNRISEMADYKSAMLAPTWDCRIPRNVNDFELRPEMKSLSETHEKSTEALFAVVRSEMSNFIRHSAFHLDFTNPYLKSIAKANQNGPNIEGSELITLERKIEDKYLAFCNPEDPLHFMTMWTARAYLAKNRLLEHYSKYAKPSVRLTDTQRDSAISYSLTMLECDTKLMTSPLTKQFIWLLQLLTPFPAYIHILQDLKKRPIQEHATKAWEIMDLNYHARWMSMDDENPIFKVFSTIMIQAWETYEAALGRLEGPLEPPRMVSGIRQKMMQTDSDAYHTENSNDTSGMNIDDFAMPTSMGFEDPSIPYGMEEQNSMGSGLGVYSGMLEQPTTDLDLGQLDLSKVDWDAIPTEAW